MSVDARAMDHYTKFLFAKVAQVVIQGRQGFRSACDTGSMPLDQTLVSLALEDIPEIRYEATYTAHTQGRWPYINPLCIEISLKTADGQAMVLETWVVSYRNKSDPNVRMKSLIYASFGQLLKSIVGVSRSLPAYGLSRRQSSATFVVCYRIFSAEPNFSYLGEDAQSFHVGDTVTAFGTYVISVDYRTSMTISPSTSASGGSTGAFQPILGASGNANTSSEGASSTTTSAESRGKYQSVSPSLNMQADHFNSPRRISSRDVKRERETRGASGGSKEDVRLPTAESSESQAGKLDNRRNRLSAGISDNDLLDNIKIGAFAVQTPILSSLKDLEDLDNDPLMKLFSGEPDKKAEEETTSESDQADKTKEKAPKKKVFDLTEDRDEEDEPAAKSDAFDLEFLEDKNPFGRGSSFSAINQDFNLFFKEAKEVKQGKNRLAQSKESLLTEAQEEPGKDDQSNSLTEQIEEFESKLSLYDDMIRGLDSESESEAPPK